MKIKKYGIIALLTLTILPSCMDVIDKPNVSYLKDDIWNSYEISQMYLDERYKNSLPSIGWGQNMNQTDEAVGSAATAFLYGSAINGTDASYNNTFWNRIRYLNIMLENMPKMSTLPQEQQVKLLAQARFLRAIEYWQIVRLYGGIPIQREPIDVQFDEDDLPRNTTKECVDFIVEDLDYAIRYLPDAWESQAEDYGRLTRLAALAYKGRVLLHFASPMFTERDAYTAVDGNSIGSYSIDSVRPGAKAARWDSAYTANKLAYNELISNGYALMPDFKSAFKDAEGTSGTGNLVNTEAVLVRRYTGTGYTHDWERRIRPLSMSGVGYNINPTWELATAFPTKEGKYIYEAGSGYQDKFYWINRDPRFYATLVYNSAIWNMQGTVGRKQWCYTGVNTEDAIPLTGFYCKKGQDSLLTQSQLSLGKTDWIEIRMAEVMLNLAESALETNRMSEAVDLIRQIRRRAGILEGTDASKAYGVSDALTKVQMLDLIMRERLIELAFENQRYWDLRRRMMFTRDLSTTTLKLNNTLRRGIDNAVSSTKKMPDGVTLIKDWLKTNKDTLTLTTANYYTYFLSFYLKKLDNNTNNLPSKGILYRNDYNFLPIPVAMLKNSTATVQTLGWDRGTFDPLAE